MKYTMQGHLLTSLLLLATSAASSVEDQPYNASSGWVALTGPDVSSTYSNSLYPWLVEWRVYAHNFFNEGQGILTNHYLFKDTRFHLADTADGWHMCNAMYMANLVRNTTDPVDPLCTGILSNDCILALRNRTAPRASSDRICDNNFKMGDLDAKACGLEPFFSRGEPEHMINAFDHLLMNSLNRHECNNAPRPA
jgi:hypothetical protein